MKKLVFLACLFLSVWFLLSTLFLVRGHGQLHKLSMELEEKRKDTHALMQEVEDLKAFVRALNQREEVQEMFMRDQLGLIKRDESVFVFPDEKTP